MGAASDCSRSRKRTFARRTERMDCCPPNQTLGRHCSRCECVMGPAIRVPGSGGLVTAKALTAAARVQPDSEPGLLGLLYRITGSPTVPEKGL